MTFMVRVRAKVFQNCSFVTQNTLVVELILSPCCEILFSASGFNHATARVFFTVACPGPRCTIVRIKILMPALGKLLMRPDKTRRRNVASTMAPCIIYLI